ncbi:MAG: glycine--tRNA ligase subunit beta, partial [Coriobacteriia bacterium]|nr:glycine--tRNA ligase subunit beta [Coriobacteriia bacterium]
EHYQPRFAGDEVPTTAAGRLVSVADKLDTMAGIFGMGMSPTGSADPYALRRSAIGILTMILDGMPLTLDEAIGAALDGYHGVLEDLSANTVGPKIREFFNGRLDVMLRDQGFAYDVVDAVMARASDDPADTWRRVKALAAFRGSDAGADLAIAFKRAMNLADPAFASERPQRDLLAQDEERTLVDALDQADANVKSLMEEHDYEGALAELAHFRAPVDAFFDEVLVMAEDESLRANRMKILNQLVGLFADFADFGRLVG